ncbi:RNA polymerase sigma-70 factor, ECF subfamily [Flexibacter flexilis DSM 6793]|uniref:RNA polymerase sigma-70 factor, ECF subfamily n=1 Tax=Flexibacter flexilis DSM 6793 TaxID=927664 RepID=A0A1I1K3V3_9BACT|nr:sigma-70 family RNA polymerase sigma factor [Flexibacter flexilis]SFC52260.1 RNA polymerase sigma-70 factor, ECF subfamily [Flexibacter flexilis DSM 6793]
MKKVELRDDATLLNLYKNGNEEAFVQLVTRHKSRIYTTIYLIVKDRYIAEDLLQETFIKVVDVVKQNRYNEEGKFLPWVLRIAHNMAIDYFRKEKRYPSIVLEDGSNLWDGIGFDEDSAEDLHIKRDTKNHLRQLINRLPEAQREVLILRHFVGMSFQEIAEETGVSINTALGRMRYALINLRKYMQQNSIRYDQNIYSG